LKISKTARPEPHLGKKGYFMTDNITVLHEDDSAKLVQLGKQYDENRGSLDLTISRFDEHGAVLSRSNTLYGEPQSLHLVVSEADAFCKAWEAFRAELQAKKEAEARRQGAVLDKVFSIAKQVSAISIQPVTRVGGAPAWHVCIPSLNFGYDWAGTPDELLEQVKGCQKRWQQHEVEQQLVEEAEQLVKESGGVIHVSKEGEREWFIFVLKVNIFNEYAQSPEQLLDRVKEAKACYDDFMARQQAQAEAFTEETNTAESELPTLQEAYTLAQEHGITMQKHAARVWAISTNNFSKTIHDIDSSGQKVLDAVKEAQTHVEQDMVSTND
jgi:hypothetical protein